MLLLALLLSAAVISLLFFPRFYFNESNEFRLCVVRRRRRRQQKNRFISPLCHTCGSALFSVSWHTHAIAECEVWSPNWGSTIALEATSVLLHAKSCSHVRIRIVASRFVCGDLRRSSFRRSDCCFEGQLHWMQNILYHINETDTHCVHAYQQFNKNNVYLNGTTFEHAHNAHDTNSFFHLTAAHYGRKANRNSRMKFPLKHIRLREKDRPRFFHSHSLMWFSVQKKTMFTLDSIQMDVLLVGFASSPNWS